MFGLGPLEIGIIVVVILLLFGPRQLPKLAHGFGETLREIKQFNKEVEKTGETFKKSIDEVKK